MRIWIKSGLNITMSAVDPGIQTLAADAENTLIVRIQVRSADGAPVHGAEVGLEAVADTLSPDIAKAGVAGSITGSAGSNGSSAEIVAHLWK